MTHYKQFLETQEAWKNQDISIYENIKDSVVARNIYNNDILCENKKEIMTLKISNENKKLYVFNFEQNTFSSSKLKIFISNSKDIDILIVNTKGNSKIFLETDIENFNSQNINLLTINYGENNESIFKNNLKINDFSNIKINSISHAHKYSNIHIFNNIPIYNKNIEYNEENLFLQSADSKVVWNSLVYISNNGEKVKTKQVGHSITEGKSKTYGRPNLFIERSDVDCEHGFAKGKSDINQINYLLNRGLSIDKAKKIINQSKIISIINTLSNEESIIKAINLYKELGEIYE